MIGKQAVVLEEINPHTATGRVRIEREEWRADTYGAAIPKGALVVVMEVTGTRVMVEPASAYLRVVRQIVLLRSSVG